MRKRTTMVQRVLLPALLGLVACGASLADDKPGLGAEAILRQQEAIRADAEGGKGRFKRLHPDKRADLYARQDRVRELLAGVGSTAELPAARQIELANALEAIRAIVDDAEDGRMICERHKPVGSNRPTTICKTVAERRAEQNGLQDDMARRNLDCSEDTLAMGPGGCAKP